jgi:hypothetical protein
LSKPYRQEDRVAKIAQVVEARPLASRLIA